jgi:hypothetical protein
MIKIGKLLNKKARRNVFVLFIQTMIGDADGEGFMQIEAKKEDIEEEIAFVRSLENESDFSPEQKEQLTLRDWPREPYSDIHQALDGFSVTFFDETGHEREVIQDGNNLSAMKKYHIPE